NGFVHIEATFEEHEKGSNITKSVLILITCGIGLLFVLIFYYYTYANQIIYDV
ncbi:Hypothetical protein EIN_319190, partial [Entamoeba invadens IP1]